MQKVQRRLIVHTMRKICRETNSFDFYTEHFFLIWVKFFFLCDCLKYKPRVFND